MSASVSSDDPLTPSDECTAVLHKRDGGVVYLLGTSHCSEDSMEHARRLVRRKQPSAVVVELCDSRAALLTQRDPAAAAHDKPASDSVVSSFSNVLADWTELLAIQYQVLESLGVSAGGSEFAAAAEAAREVGAEIVLGDREVGLTRARLQRLVPISEVVLSTLGLDTSAAREVAIARMDATNELSQRSAALLGAIARADAARGTPSEPEALGALRRQCADVAARSARERERAVPDYCECTNTCVRTSCLHTAQPRSARTPQRSGPCRRRCRALLRSAIVMDLLKRFWCFEFIGADERRRLRQARGPPRAAPVGPGARATPTAQQQCYGRLHSRGSTRFTASTSRTCHCCPRCGACSSTSATPSSRTRCAAAPARALWEWWARLTWPASAGGGARRKPPSTRASPRRSKSPRCRWGAGSRPPRRRRCAASPRWAVIARASFATPWGPSSWASAPGQRGWRSRCAAACATSRRRQCAVARSGGMTDGCAFP